MAFLERQIRHGFWLRVSGPVGEEHVDAQLVGEIEEYSSKLLVPVPTSLLGRCRNKLAWSIRRVEGWGARIAPFGLLDQTAWDVFISQIEAERYLDYLAYLHGPGDIQVFGQG